jgi:hypothetical protein
MNTWVNTRHLPSTYMLQDDNGRVIVTVIKQLGRKNYIWVAEKGGSGSSTNLDTAKKEAEENVNGQ